MCCLNHTVDCVSCTVYCVNHTVDCVCCTVCHVCCLCCTMCWVNHTVDYVCCTVLHKSHCRLCVLHCVLYLLCCTVLYESHGRLCVLHCVLCLLFVLYCVLCKSRCRVCVLAGWAMPRTALSSHWASLRKPHAGRLKRPWRKWRRPSLSSLLLLEVGRDSRMVYFVCGTSLLACYTPVMKSWKEKQSRASSPVQVTHLAHRQVQL